MEVFIKHSFCRLEKYRRKKHNINYKVTTISAPPLKVTLSTQFVLVAPVIEMRVFWIYFSFFLTENINHNYTIQRVQRIPTIWSISGFFIFISPVGCYIVTIENVSFTITIMKLKSQVQKVSTKWRSSTCVNIKFKIWCFILHTLL